jgi:hypothetical protein
LINIKNMPKKEETVAEKQEIIVIDKIIQEEIPVVNAVDKQVDLVHDEQEKVVEQVQN